MKFAKEENLMINFLFLIFLDLKKKKNKKKKKKKKKKIKKKMIIQFIIYLQSLIIFGIHGKYFQFITNLYF